MPGAIQSQDLLRVLVFATAARLSVHQACEQFARAPSGPTVLGTLASQFTDLDALESHVNDLLARLIPKGLGKRGRMDVVLRTLLARLVTLGMCIKLLLLDRGFYSVRGIQDLMTCGLPFIMPAVKRGKKPTTAGGPTGTYALAETKHGQ